MYVVTFHYTLLAIDTSDQTLKQVDALSVPPGWELVDVDPTEVIKYRTAAKALNGEGYLIADGQLRGHKFINRGHGDGFHLLKDKFVRVPPRMLDVIADAESPLLHETFYFIDASEAPAYLNVKFQLEEQLRDRVTELARAGEPIRLHFGCGPMRIPGFLNIDKNLYFGYPVDYYRFDFADKPWPIPDNSVDYVFSEDFIEHIPQRNQIGFLAEAFRVLKPNCFHRVNTPCLIASMARHSDFTKGFRGVHFAEFDKWHHVALFTRGFVEDVAKVIGYRQVFHTTKNHGSSPFAAQEVRPSSDRDQLTGNIFADLLK